MNTSTKHPEQQIAAIREILLNETEEQDLPNMVRVNILVPASVRKQWKAFGVQTDKTVTDMIIEAMAQYTEQRAS